VHSRASRAPRRARRLRLQLPGTVNPARGSRCPSTATEDLLGRIHQTGSRGVILDVSGLDTLDSEEFSALRRIVTMTALLGAESVVAGLRPGIVSSLIETGAEVDGLRAAIDLDAAFALLRPEAEPEPEAEPDVEDEAGAGEDTDREGGLPPAEPPPEAGP
jgi:rsbT antagonist protein RsbS